MYMPSTVDVVITKVDEESEQLYCLQMIQTSKKLYK